MRQSSETKSLYYISHAVSYFYKTEIEILAGFGPAGKFRVHEFLVCVLNNFLVESSLDF